MNTTAEKTSRATTATQPAHRKAGLFRAADTGPFFGGNSFFGGKGSAVQAKLEVSRPGDPQEREADQSAEQVITMPEPAGVQPAASEPAPQEPRLDRLQESDREEEEILQPKLQDDARSSQTHQKLIEHPAQAVVKAASSAPAGERKVPPDFKPRNALSRMIQRRHAPIYRSDVVQHGGRGPPAAGLDFETQLFRTKGTGNALPTGTRAFMENRFHSDFGSVRIHTDDSAQSLSRTIHAQAFTHGGDIYFNSGRYNPDSTTGRFLLAHELTHTIQQGASPAAKTGSISQTSAAMAAPAPARRFPERQEQAPSRSSVKGAAPQTSGARSNADTKPGGGDKKLDRSLETETEEREIEEVDWRPSLHLKAEPDHESNALPSPTHAETTEDRREPVAENAALQARTDSVTAGAPSVNAGVSSHWQSARGPPAAPQTSNPTVQRSWLGDAWDAVSDAASDAVDWAEDQLSAAKQWALEKVGNLLRGLKGYSMLCFILGEDPITGARMPRNGRNLLYAGLDLMPAGGIFREVIERLGIVDDLAQFMDSVLDRLKALAGGILNDLKKFWDGLGIGDLRHPTKVFDDVVELLASVFERIINFLVGVAKDFLEMIKRVMLRLIVDFVRGRIPRLYPLLCVALGHDPVTGEEVKRNGTNILNAILEVSEWGREQRQQMQDTGTFQKIAGFIDKGIWVFTTAYDELRQAFSSIWDIVSIDTLRAPIETFSKIYDKFSAPVLLVTNYILEVGGEILRAIKEVLFRRISAYAKSFRGYTLITVIIGRDPFTGEQVSRNTENLIHGFMALMDGGEEQFKQLKESGAIDKTAARVSAAVGRLNLTPASIARLFINLWDSFSLSDIVHPLEAFKRIIGTLFEPIRRLIAFVIEIVKIVVEVILMVMNFPVDLIANIINRTIEAFHLIKSDPVGFLKNLLRAIKQGFSQFFDNIAKHLVAGLTKWLLSELRDAGVTEPKDFTFQGILAWVLELLGISAEKIWQKLGERIGVEKVNKIRAMIDKLEGVWSFIKDVQERGIAAIWDKIQERLSSLWDVILSAIERWITEQIISKITAKLLTMLDPTGIMAVINSAIALYRAVQSFIRYLREMLQIVNSFVVGILEIAGGDISKAADSLEQALADGVPIVIGFLANQVGLGGLGERIGEMIGNVRDLVDQALTWLVDKAVTTGANALNALLAAGRSAVGAVKAWAAGLLGLQQPFTVPNEGSHRLYYAEEGDGVTLMMNSVPAGKYEEKMEEINPPAAPNDRVALAGPISIPLQKNNAVVNTILIQPDADKKISLPTLKSKALEVAKHIDGLIASRRQTSSDASQQANIPGAAAGAQQQTADFTASLQGLSQVTAYLVSAGPTGPLPITPVPAYGGLANGFATRMEVAPLTRLGVPGSGVSASSPDYEALLLRRENPGGRSFYIAGHLLNNNVHGDGSTWQNLTPIAQKTNQQHEARVESKVKEAVLDKGLIMHYTVEVDYAVPRKQNLLAEIEKDPNWMTNSALSEKHQIIEAEAKLPTRLRCTVRQIKPDGSDLPSGGPGFDAQYNISGAAGTIDNESNVPQASLAAYYLASATAVTYLDAAALKVAAENATKPPATSTWDDFYKNPEHKVSIDHLEDAQKEELRQVFRKQDLINEERGKIEDLKEVQSEAAFQGGRIAYTSKILDDADKADLKSRFDQHITQLRAAFEQTITDYVNNDLKDPETKWGDFRNNWHLGARMTDTEKFKTTVFDPRIKALKSAAGQPAGAGA